MVIGAWCFAVGTASFLLLPPSLHAQEYGVSAYTRRVLERAHIAEEALTATGGTAAWNADDMWSWLQTGMSAVFGTRDTAITRTAEQLRLSQMTACQFADISLILQEMEKVRGLLKQARDAKKTLSVLRLSSLYEFLNERLQVVEWGGTLPGAEDTEWSAAHSFDPPGERERIAEERLCPFSTKYADVSVDRRYGCTVEVMDEALAALYQSDVSYGTMTSTEAERDALAALLAKLETLPGSSASAAAQVEGCVTEWPEEYRTWSSGRFQEIPGGRYLTLLKLIWHIELLRPSAYLPDNPLTWNVGKAVLNPLLAYETQVFSTQQAKDDSLLRIGVVESQGIEEAFSPLTDTIGDLARLVQDIDPVEGDRVSSARSLRDFVRDMAFFLRRSCMNRSCNATLERVMKITTADSCFPYTSGEADLPPDATAEEKEAKARELQRECAEEAGVEEGSL
ncbi:MAG: hypothetical protein WCV62_02865 [Candidatus Peribacteraceae bacterium]